MFEYTHFVTRRSYSPYFLSIRDQPVFDDFYEMYRTWARLDIIRDELISLTSDYLSLKRTLERKELFKEELIQETHKIGSFYYQESLREGLKLWNSHMIGGYVPML